MCGLIGIITKEKHVGAIARKKVFEEMLFADTLRGPHGTGIFAVDHGEEKSYLAQVYKKALAAPDFLQLKGSQLLLSVPGALSCMIGHNRWATSGGISDDTSHPFQHGNITMVHNGTLQYHDNLVGGKDFIVDSEAICHSISEVGIEKTATQLDGAFALIWHDATDGTLNMLRNDDRPLSFTKLKNEETWVLASESAMLRWILERNKVEHKQIFHLKPGALITFDLADPSSYKHKMIPMSTDIDETWWKGYSYGGYGSTLVNSESPEEMLEKKTGLKIGDKAIAKMTTKGSTYEKKCSLNGFINGDSSVDVVMYQLEEKLAASYLGQTIRGTIASVYKEYHSGTAFVNVVLKKGTIEIVDAKAANDINITDLNLPDLDADDDVGEIMGAYDREITKKEYLEKTKDGCAWCTSDLPIEKHSEVVWEGMYPFCAECAAEWREASEGTGK